MPITSQWLKIDLHCLQNIVFHFWPQLTHPAARSLCNSWTTFLFIADPHQLRGAWSDL